jgi:hypothetical protein
MTERDVDLDYSERAGFQVGKAAAMAEWRARKEIDDPEFQRLVWRLQAQKLLAEQRPRRQGAHRRVPQAMGA